MDLRYTPEEQAFRAEVRDFIAANLPEETRRKVKAGEPLRKDEYVAWQRILFRQGWIAPAWPERHGGTGWSAMQRHIFNEELAYDWAPRTMPFGLGMVGPVLIEFGTDAQRERYLPRILNSEDWWCQGYSEPGAGSDLAALATSARRDGERYVVSGTKTWTTFAQYADLMFALVRTSRGGKKQEGISFLLIDMRAPGVTVRPIVTLDGGSEINEVHLEEVAVPIENRVGDEGAGWTIAKFLLEHERTGVANVARCRQQLALLRETIARTGSGGQRFEERVASVEIQLEALACTEMRALAAESAGTRPGAESSILKIVGTEVQQALTELALDAVGPYASPADDPVAARAAPAYFNFRKASIYAGSNEIQKNIIAKRILGL